MNILKILRTCFLAAMLPTVSARSSAQTRTSVADGLDHERAVEAAFLCKYKSYVTWPASVFASPSDSFSLCIVGADPFGSLLDRDVRGQKVHQHPVVILREPGVLAPRNCQLLYIGQINPDAARRLLAATRSLPVLTVTAASRHDLKGLINFTIENNHVRFEIDSSAASKAGLTISSRLLSVAMPARSVP